MVEEFVLYTINSLRHLQGSVLLIAWSLAFTRNNHQDRLLQLYNNHQWFALRDSSQSDKNAPPLHRGSVAAAFNNRARAERAFAVLFKKYARSDAAYQAHEWLTSLYMRAGLYGRAVAETKAKWMARPDLANDPGEHQVVAMLGGLPDQTTQAAVPSQVACTEAGLLQLKLNGKRAEFFVDTDSNLSFLSESAARALDLKIRLNGAEAYGAAG